MTITFQGPTYQPDPQPAIASTPIGGTWDGGGLTYIVPNGVWVTHACTIQNAFFVKPDTSFTRLPPQDGFTQEYGNHPVVRIQGIQSGATVTFNKIGVGGSNLTGAGLRLELVGQHGFEVLGTANLVMNNCFAGKVFGDGMIFNVFGGNVCSNVTVNGFGANLIGRVGITPAALWNSTLTNIRIYTTAAEAIDFESDNPGVGSGYVTFNGLYCYQKSVRIIEILGGPLTFNGIGLNGHITVMDRAGLSGQLVSFNGGNAILPVNPTNPPGGIYLNGGANVLFQGILFGTSNNPNAAFYGTTNPPPGQGVIVPAPIDSSSSDLGATGQQWLGRSAADVSVAPQRSNTAMLASGQQGGTVGPLFWVQKALVQQGIGVPTASSALTLQQCLYNQVLMTPATVGSLGVVIPDGSTVTYL